jgi:hypothetical protein
MADAPDIEALWERACAYCKERQGHAYPLQPERWYTGVCPDGHQLLAVYDDTNAIICWLDGDGQHRASEVVAHGIPDGPGAYWQRDEYPQLHEFLRERFGYRDGSIRVRPFEDRAAGVAVKPMPYWIYAFVLDPYEREGDQQAEVAGWVEEWLDQDDTYALEAWGNTFFIDSGDGHCTAS